MTEDERDARDGEREIDAAVARFRAELAANAAIGAAETGELADHLRAIIDDERAAGATPAAAIAIAQTRLGTPALLAAECTRVRTAFGARLGPARTWTAAAIFAATWAYAAWMWLPQLGVASHVGAELGLGLILLPGLVIGSTWTRAILFGTAIVLTATSLVWIAILHHRPGTTEALLVASYAAAAVLLAPLSLRELAPAGWSLVAWSIAYFGATNAVPLARMTLGEILPITALAGIWLAALGTVLRARWGAVIGLITAAMLGVILIGVAMVHSTRTMTIYAPYHEFAFAMTVIALAAAIAAPLLAWRDSRRGFGAPRALLIA